MVTSGLPFLRVQRHGTARNYYYPRSCFLFCRTPIPKDLVLGESHKSQPPPRLHPPTHIREAFCPDKKPGIERYKWAHHTLRKLKYIFDDGSRYEFASGCHQGEMIHRRTWIAIKRSRLQFDRKVRNSGRVYTYDPINCLLIANEIDRWLWVMECGITVVGTL